jgi:hypothetical protein
MDQCKAYVGGIQLQSADKLIFNKADNGHVVVVEYEIHGTLLATGVTYENRFCSIVELGNRKITRWRDYVDSHAALMADDDALAANRSSIIRRLGGNRKYSQTAWPMTSAGNL